MEKPKHEPVLVLIDVGRDYTGTENINLTVYKGRESRGTFEYDNSQLDLAGAVKMLHESEGNFTEEEKAEDGQ